MIEDTSDAPPLPAPATAAASASAGASASVSASVSADASARAAKRAAAEKKAAAAVETARKRQVTKRKFKAPKNMYELKKTFHQFSHDQDWLLEYVCSIKFSKWKKLFGKGSVDVEALSTIIKLLADAEDKQLTRGYSILKIVSQAKSIGMALMLLSDGTLQTMSRVFEKFEAHVDASAVAELKTKFGI